MGSRTLGWAARGVCIGVLAACGGAGDGEAPQQAPPSAPSSPAAQHAPGAAHGETAAATGGSKPAENAPLRGAHARLTRLEGGVTDIAGGDPLEAPVALDGLVGLRLADGARTVIDLPSHGRAVVEGPAQVYVGGDRQAQVLLVEGRVHLLRAPGGLARAPAPRVATADASVELAGGGEVLVATDPRRGTYVASLAGGATLSTGEASAQGELRSLALAAGSQTVVAADTWPTAEDGSTDLAAARDAVAGALAGLERGKEAAARAAEAASGFEAIASKLSAARTEGHGLVERQRKSAKAKQREVARELQPAVVANARVLLRLRATLFVRWERLQVRSLAARPLRGPGAADGAPFGAYSAQARGLLGAPPE